MEISEEQLRQMVRDAIARNSGQLTGPVVAHDPTPGHASHGLLRFLASGDADGQCLIEPAVRCNHCGYCQSMGH